MELEDRVRAEAGVARRYKQRVGELEAVLVGGSVREAVGEGRLEGGQAQQEVGDAAEGGVSREGEASPEQFVGGGVGGVAESGGGVKWGGGAEMETGGVVGVVSELDGRAKGGNRGDVASWGITGEVASWAQVAGDEMQQQERRAIWQVPFEGQVPVMGEGQVVMAIRGAVQRSDNFEMREVGGVISWNYKEPGPEHFVWRGLGGGTERTAGWRRAYLRRELRGLVLRDTGEVVARGLHKFFNVGQIRGTSVRDLRGKVIGEVLEKLDGQMVMGVVVGGQVQWWSRRGFTEVGVSAWRVAREVEDIKGGDCAGLVRQVVESECTAVFELVGPQSRVKADEGCEARLVLIAVRVNRSGQYWGHEELVRLGAGFGVEVVRRLRQLEALELGNLVGTVRAWVGREGVVVRFVDGQVVKVKSWWWFRSGFTGKRRQEAAEWALQEQDRRKRQERKHKVKSQRMAIVGFRGAVKAVDLFGELRMAKKVELVYSAVSGRLRVAIVSFDSVEQCKESLQVAGKLWKASYAYSNRTCVGMGVRLETFWRDMVM